jgi:hypothetical protein
MTFAKYPPRSTGHEKLAVPQEANKFSAFYRNMLNFACRETYDLVYTHAHLSKTHFNIIR